VTSIGGQAFASTPFFKNQPDGLVVFNNVLYAMKGSGSATVVIPDGVTSIGSRAFSGCSGLTSITIPKSVTHIGSSAFGGCGKLERVVFEGDAPVTGRRLFASLWGSAGPINPDTTDVASNCCAYVRRESTGWGVEIPGKWKGIAIDYLPDEK